MAKKSSYMSFSDDIMNELEQYGMDVAGGIGDIVDDVSKEAVRKLKSESPKQTGQYSKGWTREIEKTRVTVSATVYGKDKHTYALAHLLEYGHVTSNGTTRSFPRTPAHPHIEQVEEWANSELEDRIVSDIEKGKV